MENEMIIKDNSNFMLDEIANTEKVCISLMKTAHYSKIGRDGIFAIVQKAASLGIKPIEALNGGMYYVQGKVELSAIMMAKLIRQQKHSITMDKNSTSTCCILHGKRADNGDTWRASFSIDDAKRAGIYKENSPWTKYPDVMCYNRALSKIARQLFPDVIGNCYVEGEISEAVQTETQLPIAEMTVDVISEKDALFLEENLVKCTKEFQETVRNFLLQRFGTATFESLPKNMLQSLTNKIKNNLQQEEVRVEIPEEAPSALASTVATNILQNLTKQS